MDKVSISRFTEKVIEQHGSDKAEAVLIIAIDGHNVTTSAIGIDPLCINDKSIALAGAMLTILEEKFNFASTIYKTMRANGRIKSELQENTVEAPVGMFDAEAPKESRRPESPKKNPDKEAAEKLVEGMLDLLERTLGGSMNANDD